MKLAIIKLGAKGDVVRTLSILIAIKEEFPDSEITWITKTSSKEILKTSPYIDKLITIPAEINEKFDILYNFDIDKEATDLAESLNANKKLGFYNKDGFVTAFNFPAEYYLNTLFDDEFKKNNKKTYQQMMFEAAELPYKKQHHPISLQEQNKEYAENLIKQNNINTENLIGIHIGSSPRWPSKAWDFERIKEFIIKAKSKDYEILLFAGIDDIEKQKKLVNELDSNNLRIFQNNPHNSDLEFASLVNLCKFMVCSDSFALHVSLALKKPTIGLFFCTSPDEIEDYGLLKKIISPMLKDFFPEKMDQYSEELTKSISAEEVLEALTAFSDRTTLPQV
jgi:heptosyltransferase-2